MSGSSAAVVDAYLGASTYSAWQQLSMQTIGELGRFRRLQGTLDKIDTEITWQFAEDFAVLEKLASDYRRGMELVERGQPVLKDELDSVIEMYALAHEIAECDNDLLEQIAASEFIRAFAKFPFALIENREKELDRSRQKFKRELAKARSVVKQVKLQIAFSVVGLVETSLPGVGLAVKLYNAFIQNAVDDVLGAKKSWLMDKVDKVADVAGPAANVVEEFESLGKRVTNIAKVAGKAIDIVGLIADFDELRVAYRDADKWAAAAIEVEKDFDRLVRLVLKHLPELRRLSVLLQQLKQRTWEFRRTAASLRERLRTLRIASRYPTDRPKAWSLAPQGVAVP
jgi:hypothetical protein